VLGSLLAKSVVYAKVYKTRLPCAETRFLALVTEEGTRATSLGPINGEEVTLEPSVLGVVCRAGVPDVLWESPEPPAIDFSYLFERNNPHLPPSVTELFLGEPVRRTSFFDEGGRCGSVC
jgi:hypothetical protein